jgi:hypothetical protein
MLLAAPSDAPARAWKDIPSWYSQRHQIYSQQPQEPEAPLEFARMSELPSFSIEHITITGN